jgi:O-antigen biosynthesis protein
MISPRPLVSVIISSPGPGALLDRTMQAIEAQSFPAIELLVFRPPGETTGEMICTPRFRPLFLEMNAGAAAAWNAGIVQASGHYICCLLAGDHVSSTFLEKCLFYMEVGGLHAAAAYEDPSDEHPHICVVRKQVLKEIGGYDAERPVATQRVELVCRMADHGYLRGEVPEVLAQPVDPPGEDQTLACSPLPAAISQGRSSYDQLVTGAPAQQPTVLVAMPFLTVGGAEATMSQACHQLNGLGFRILICTTVRSNPVQGNTAGWFGDSVVGIYDLPGFLDAEHWPAFIAYLIQQHGVSVLWMVGSSYIYGLLPQLRELFPQLAIVDLLFNSESHVNNYLKYNYLIDRVVTEHPGMKQWLLERGEDEEQVRVIANGVDLGAYAPGPKLDWRTRQPRQVSGNPFVVAFFGRLSSEKGPDLFLDIAQRLVHEPGFEFLVFGSGPMERALRERNLRCGSNQRVHFLGFVSSRDYLPCCDVVVVCSRLDGRPNILMESWAAGVPVVASRVGGIPTMTPPGQEDLLCDPANVDTFVDAIQRLARDVNRYRQSSELGRSHAERDFSAAGRGKLYASLFEQLRRQRKDLYRPVTAEKVAASLGYNRERKATGPASMMQRFWMAFSPRSWLGYVRNLLLLWGIRRRGEGKKLLAQFDAHFYARHFPRGTGPRWPLLHYIFLGFLEGRNPSADFDTRSYLASNPDVRLARMNPLLHYIVWGQQEGRLITSRPKPYAAPRRDGFEQSGAIGSISTSTRKALNSWSRYDEHTGTWTSPKRSN